jgi:hypothetical protein
VDLAVGTITAEGRRVDDLGALSIAGRTHGSRGARRLRRGISSRRAPRLARLRDRFAAHPPRRLGTTNVSLSLGFPSRDDAADVPRVRLSTSTSISAGEVPAHVDGSFRLAALEAVGRDRMMTVRYRLQRGRLVSLLGNPHPWPDTLRLNADVSLKVKLFRVGFSKLATDFVIGNSGHDRSWTITAQREPGLGSPVDHGAADSVAAPPTLRRRGIDVPGVRCAIARGMQTLFTRAGRLEVQESTIMRLSDRSARTCWETSTSASRRRKTGFIRDGFAPSRRTCMWWGGRWRAETENGAQR